MEAPEGATVRYSLLRVEDYDGTEDLTVRCLVLAALEYAPGEPVPRSILALRSPMALTGDGSAFEGRVFAALYSGRNLYCNFTGGSRSTTEGTYWVPTNWIGVNESGTGEALSPEAQCLLTIWGRPPSSSPPWKPEPPPHQNKKGAGSGSFFCGHLFQESPGAQTAPGRFPPLA